ncbi:hypothetical protein FKW77_000423 [Venturia effusa]|uniref:Glyceraldehyde 3-phosphate phosphatase n=1 Tax=Venturia effusa TaxID=50376 RepID=A0A517LQG7_9PEZI|nr:hypothetical protein FKW77_000423 [Venturia effusa]
MPVKDLLLAKKWFGFDLDDTLHEFRKASSNAALEIFADIEAKYDVDILSLQPSYVQILKKTTSGAFTDGRTSAEYRQERFSALLKEFNINYTNNYVDELVEKYKFALQSALTLKPGALELLRHLRETGKHVIVITEGPADAQKWTVHELGLEPYVNVLVTTNETGKSKVDGLIAEVLRLHQIPAQDMVYIGDNEARDIVPARQVGVLAIHYNEMENSQLDVEPLRTQSLETLRILMESRLEKNSP